MRKIRVLLACNQLGIGGAEKTIQIFCKYLDRSKFDIYACGLRAGGIRADELKRLGVTVIVAPKDLNELVRDLDIDIYHIHRGGDYEPGTLPRKSHGKPRVIETNIFEGIDWGENSIIDCHLFISCFSQGRYLARHGRFHGSRYEVLYNPVDFEEFPRRTKTYSWTIGRCSRADDQKWHDVCIRSLPRVFAQVPQARCIFQGVTERVRARVQACDIGQHVELLDMALDVASFYHRLDIFIHGSRVGETFGCVIAEAMANQLPVVTLSTPQRKKSNAQVELVEHNVTGFVVGSASAYADATIELLKNSELRQRFGQRGYEKAREQFDACKLTRKLENLYTELMDAI